MELNTSRGLVHVSVVDFGQGSVGKFHHIAQHLKDVGFTLDAGLPADIRAMLRKSSERDSSHRTAAEPQVALVINDPEAANRQRRRGRKVVYVDSLPYLWTLEAETPVHVDAYCAQKFPGRLPPDSPLLGRDIIWVDSIVPSHGAVHHGGGGVVISIGGLRGPLMTEAVQDTYIGSVVLPVLTAIRERGVLVNDLCGAVPRRWHDRLRAVEPGLRIRNLPVDEFHEVLAQADLLLTSPGSTTMLEAASMGVPTALLPPQNISQMINATTFTDSRAMSLGWPTRVFCQTQLEAIREEGELAALRLMNDRIVTFGSQIESAADEWVADVVVAMKSNSPRLRLPAMSGGGAGQVAETVRAILWSDSEARQWTACESRTGG